MLTSTVFKQRVDDAVPLEVVVNMKIEMTAANGATIVLTNPNISSSDAAHDMTNRAIELFQSLMVLDKTEPLPLLIEGDDD